LESEVKSKVNIHKDHEATCLCCASFFGTFGRADYSDLTPGDPPQIQCFAGGFETVHGHNDCDNFSLHELVKIGRFCEFFRVREIEEIDE
jgi:hypothetical protein